MDLISVIVPVYKVEDYLCKCIESICNQTYTNLEIILVDDGSPDNCPSICDNYAKKDTRIKVIHKINGGLSDARNVGTDLATGKYIFYVDSDDYVDNDIIEILYTELLNNNSEIAVSRYDKIYNNTISEKRVYNENIIKGTGSDILYDLLSDGGWTAWGKLYKREIIGNNRFTKGILYEDFDLIPSLFIKTNKALIVNRPMYHYLVRDNSIMGVTKYHLKNDFIIIMQKNLGILYGSNLNPNSIEKLTGKLYKQFFREICVQVGRNRNTENVPFISCSRIMVKKYFKKILKNNYLPSRYKLMFSMLTINQSLFLNVCRLYANRFRR